MKSRNATFSLILILLILSIGIFKWRREPKQKEAFNRNPELFTYTQQARCQMQCQGVSEKDIRVIMKKGIINLSRSNRRGQPCPTFALQGRTANKKYVRVLFAQCRKETEVLNFYNLEEDVACPCSGEEAKN